MKPRPRIRKVVKWGGTALVVLLLVVWLTSGWWHVQMPIRQSLMVSTGAGLCNIGTLPPSNGRGFFPFSVMRSQSVQFGWWV